MHRGIVISTAVIACGLGLALVVAALVLAPSASVAQVAGVTVGLSSALVFASVAGLGFIARMRRTAAARLDPSLAPLGMRGSAHLVTGRQLHGTVDGRKTDALVGRDGRVDLWVEVASGTRLSVGSPGLAPSSGEPLPWPDLEARAQDPEWARRLLREHDTVRVIQRLAQGAAEDGRGWLLIEPDALHMVVHRHQRAAVVPAASWHADLCRLALVIEAIPPPAEPTQSTWIEIANRTDPGKLVRLATLITVLLVGGTTLLAVLIAVFAVSST